MATQALSPLTKLGYLGGFISRPGQGRDWLQGKLANPDQRALGALLALPNTLTLASLGMFSAFFGTRTGVLLLGLAPIIMLVGAFFGPVTRKRISYLSRKNGFDRNTLAPSR